MNGQIQYPCGGPVQSAMLFPAIVAFGFYSIAVPGIALWFLRSKVSANVVPLLSLRPSPTHPFPSSEKFGKI